MNDCRKIYHAGALTDVLEILCREFRRFRIGGDHSGNPTDYERSVVQRSRSEEATNSVSVLLQDFPETIHYRRASSFQLA